MCLWDVSDGRCIENTKIDKVHSEIKVNIEVSR